MKVFGRIYRIKNTVNGMIYVGQTVRAVHVRFSQHARHDPAKSPLSAAIRKYGKEAFEITILRECLSQADMNSSEADCIEIFDCLYPKGYNLRPGGDQSPPTPESRAKQAAAMRGRKQSPEVVERRIAPLRGRKRSAESLAKAQETYRKRAMLRAKDSQSKQPKTQRAEENGNARLTWTEVREIRQLYALGDISQAEIAKRFGVKQTAISRIVRGVRWPDKYED